MLALLAFAFLVHAQAQEYFMARQGDNCYVTCAALGLNCNGQIQTNNSNAIFGQLGVTCKADTRPWWAEDQPSYVSDPSDGNYGDCLGYTDVPQDVMCGGHFNTTSRLCRCSALRNANDLSTFGTGLSGGSISQEEFQVFGWTMPSGSYGVMDHFWITGPNNINWDDVVIRYYVDGEATASVQFTPSMAAGVGFNDGQAPWGNKFVGKGAADGAWYVNLRVPFQKQIRVTWQHLTGTYGGMYIIVRGAPNLPIVIGDVTVPTNAKLYLYNQHVTLQPLQYFDVINVPSGNGLAFFHALAVQAANLNFLEGCYHQYSPPSQAYPGTVLSTGTEDYYDSAWYFNAGEFHLPNAGYTHYATAAGQLTWSAYRFHVQDPLRFNNGYRLTWRNGDAIDPQTGLKCFIQNGGNVVGSPSVATVVSYSWVYQW
eukprot:TRINITY_DN7316_c0_g2_i9.p1 TRINITY_DN7316_c0_g2~~TRINITY_DN7316_c0_g2_i9.p1  ORF type:complete len:426 (-),score=33.85 TRINITY_DN7316_c0_g2_i9:128-1405(-)